MITKNKNRLRGIIFIIQREDVFDIFEKENNNNNSDNNHA